MQPGAERQAGLKGMGRLAVLEGLAQRGPFPAAAGRGKGEALGSAEGRKLAQAQKRLIQHRAPALRQLPPPITGCQGQGPLKVRDHRCLCSQPQPTALSSAAVLGSHSGPEPGAPAQPSPGAGLCPSPTAPHRTAGEGETGKGTGVRLPLQVRPPGACQECPQDQREHLLRCPYCPRSGWHPDFLT